ncbi:MAG: glycosyltransferase family 4 protein [Dehalococcoidia bacterium]|nr:glycosyltransferase family 4 protein [Dehalococcoidia bacterium]
MKIIRIVDGYACPSTVGPNVFINVLSTELAKRGHKCIIYSTVTGNEKPVEGEINGYLVKNYKPFLRLWSFPLSINLIVDVLREQADIIHVHGYRCFHSEFALWLRVFKKVPYVLSPHASLLGYKYLAGTKISKVLHVLYDSLTFKLALRKATFVAVASNQEANEALQMGIPLGKIEVMPHAENLTGVAKPVTATKIIPRILTVGRVDPQMNWETLIRAFAIVLEHMPDAELVIVGPSSFGHTYIGFKGDYQEELLELCRELNILDKVRFPGPLFGKDLQKTYFSSAIFIYIAPYGNYGRTHIEAAAFGKPVISTPVGIAPDLVGKNEGGFLVDPYDIQGIAQAIVSLLSDAALYHAKQKVILKRVKKYLNVKQMVDEYEGLYKDAVTS